MSDAEIIRLRNPNALWLPSIRYAVFDALQSNSMVDDPLGALDDLERYLHLDEIALLLATEDGAFCGVALAQLPTTALSPRACSVLHFASSGSATSRNQLVDAVVAYAADAGYDRLIAVDMNAKPDAFSRLFRRAGAPRSVGQVFTFDIGAKP